MTTFTGRKCDLLKAMRFDGRVSDQAYRVAAGILDHLNEKTERTILSDDLIAFEIAGAPRTVRRARDLLRETGWMKWHRTRKANIYSFDFEKVGPILAMIARERSARKGKRLKIAEINGQTGQKWPLSRDRPEMATLDRPKMAAIHLRGTPSKQEAVQGRKNLRLEVASLERGGGSFSDGRDSENENGGQKRTGRKVDKAEC